MKSFASLCKGCGFQRQRLWPRFAKRGTPFPWKRIFGGWIAAQRQEGCFLQEKKHPLLAFLMPPAVRGATLRVAGLGVAACGGGLCCCWHRLLPRYAWRGLSRCGAIGTRCHFLARARK